MGIFRRMGNAFARFMYGRNGMDQLEQAALYFYLFLCVGRAVLAAFFHVQLAVRILDYGLLLLCLWIIFRMFSKNLYKRRAENQKWVNFIRRVRNGRKSAAARHADKEHKYFTCKSCKAICRVPAGKGKIVITCPKCGAQIQART